MMVQTSIDSRGSEKPRVQSSTATHFAVLEEARNMFVYTRGARKRMETCKEASPDDDHRLLVTPPNTRISRRLPTSPATTTRTVRTRRSRVSLMS